MSESPSESHNNSNSHDIDSVVSMIKLQPLQMSKLQKPSSLSIAKSMSSSFNDLALSQAPKSISNEKSITRTKSTFSIDGMDSPCITPFNQEFERLGSKSLKDELLFKDFDLKGFYGIWNHPMTRIDTKKANAVRIFNTYLSSQCSLGLRFPLNHDIRTLIAKVRLDIDDNIIHPGIFDDIVNTVNQDLRFLYHGNGAESTPPENNNSPEFKQHISYMLMQKDLRGKWKPNSQQYIKAIERLLDLPRIYLKNEDYWAKIEEFVLSLGLEIDLVKSMIEIAKQSLSFKSPLKAQSVSVVEFDDTLSKSTDDSVIIVVGHKSPVKTFTKHATFNGAEHTFVQYSGPNKHCEHCFEISDSETVTIYKCEVCDFVSHKACRKEIHVSCIKSTSAEEEQKIDQQQEIEEKISIVQNRIKSIQTEINIEARILEGLVKMTEATKSNKKEKKKVNASGSDIEIEKSRKKLEIFHNEIVKCQQQIGLLKSEQAIKIQLESEKKELVAILDNLHQDDIQKDDDDQENQHTESSEIETNDKVIPIIKFHNIDSKVIEILDDIGLSLDMLPQKWIQICFEKTGIDPSDVEYCLTQTTDNEEVELINETLLTLKEYGINANSIISIKPQLEMRNAQKDWEKQKQKTNEVLEEIIDTEKLYVTDLNSVNDGFLVPLQSIVTAEDITLIFGNIQSIVKIHNAIVNGFLIPETTHDVITVIKLFTEQLPRFSEYLIYCGNQHPARRRLNEVRDNPIYGKQISQMETNPLLNKLTLADLLVKPMHRITRYPLLFKRLLSHLKPESEEYKQVQNFVSGIESTLKLVNEIVRQNESTFRLKLIDYNIDFGNITEKFKLCVNKRELLSEKNFVLLKKNNALPVEITLLLFNDMLIITRMKKPDHYQILKPPIPFEEIVFLDKPDSIGFKHTFQILHLQQEIYTCQARTKTDKATWFLEAENARLAFCDSYIDWESNLLREKALKTQIELTTDTSYIKRRTSTRSVKTSEENIYNMNADIQTLLFRRINTSQERLAKQKAVKKKEEASVDKIFSMFGAVSSDDTMSDDDVQEMNDTVTKTAERRRSRSNEGPYTTSVSLDEITAHNTAHLRSATSGGLKERMKRNFLSKSGLASWLGRKKGEESDSGSSNISPSINPS